MKLLSSPAEVIAHIANGTRILMGGFLGVGTPESFVDALLATNITDLEVVTCDTAFPDKGVGRLIAAQRVKTVFTSHIGTNPETGKQFNNGSLTVHFSPQGTLVERIRAAGAGLGGVLTPTGLGTTVEKDKQTVAVEGKPFIVETPLFGDVAWLRAHKADAWGNLVYYRAMRNFNPIMATAASLVFVEVDELVDELDPEVIITPSPLVDYVFVNAGKK